MNLLRVQNAVISAVKSKLTEAGIDLPFPTHQVLFHDQTEESDGDRSKQREGWPAGQGRTPKPRSIASAIREAKLRPELSGSDHQEAA
jgi:small-conductance mechanosensitive channel